MSRFRPSPAMAVAVVALFAALGGAAYAGSRIGSDDLENGAVTAKKLGKGAVTKKAIAKDAVTGKAVKESSLKTVPSAATAGGLTPGAFQARTQPPAELVKVKTIGTLQIEFGCTASSGPLVTVLPAPGALPQTTRVSTVIGTDSNQLQGGGQGTLPPSGIVVLDGAEAGVSFNGTINSLTSGGEVTTINWAARSTSVVPSANPDEQNCLFWGTSLAS